MRRQQAAATQGATALGLVKLALLARRKRNAYHDHVHELVHVNVDVDVVVHGLVVGCLPCSKIGACLEISYFSPDREAPGPAVPFIQQNSVGFVRALVINLGKARRLGA